MTDRTELIAKAEELQLTFPKNISTLKLEELIISSLEDDVSPPKVDEGVPEESPAAAEEEPKGLSKLSKLELRRNAIKAAKEKAMVSRVVTITNRDNRENDAMTTAYLSFENQFFGVSKLVPLDIPVELEQGLIDVAEATMIVLHKDEIIGGKRTGNRTKAQVKKFAVSYSKQ